MSSSPSIGGFKLGDVVMVACEQGVLNRIASGNIHLGPLIPIPGLPARPVASGSPVPGPNPTKAQCAAAWNETSPLAARQAIGALTPFGATVSWSSQTSSLSATGPVCVITFVLPGEAARAATVTSLWVHGKADNWAGYVGPGGLRGFLSADETAFSVSNSGALSPR
jgi:hypothetical protein